MRNILFFVFLLGFCGSALAGVTDEQPDPPETPIDEEPCIGAYPECAIDGFPTPGTGPGTTTPPEDGGEDTPPPQDPPVASIEKAIELGKVASLYRGRPYPPQGPSKRECNKVGMDYDDKTKKCVPR